MVDNEDPFVLAVGGHILSFLGRKPSEAIDLFDQALALNQNLAFAWGLSALTLAYLGRLGVVVAIMLGNLALGISYVGTSLAPTPLTFALMLCCCSPSIN